MEDISDIPEEIIDRATFDQILEMDDDEERDFSKTIVFGFFEQAEDTFKQMESMVYVFHNSLWQLYSHILTPRRTLYTSERRRIFHSCLPSAIS